MPVPENRERAPTVEPRKLELPKGIEKQFEMAGVR